MISSRSVTAASGASTFLSGLEQAATRAILDASEFRWVRANHPITVVGNPATHFFMVQAGRARYCHLTKKGELVLLAQLVPGDVIGLMTLLKTTSTYMATAEAASDCELLVWDRAIVHNFVPLSSGGRKRLANRLRLPAKLHRTSCCVGYRNCRGAAGQDLA